MRLKTEQSELIVHVFKEPQFREFRNYCRKNKLVYMEQLKEFNFDSLLKLRTIDTNIVKEIKDKYKVITQENVKKQSTDNDEEQGINVNEIFRINKFIRYCNKKNIHKVEQLRDFDFNNLSIITSLDRNEIIKIQKNWELYVALSEDKYIKPENFNYNSISISQVYDEVEFKPFIEYCGKTNLKLMSDLVSFNFDKLRTVTSIKTNKLSKIIEIYMDYKHIKDKLMEANSEQKSQFSDLIIDEAYQDIDIVCLEILNVDKEIIGKMINKGCKKIGDISKKHILEISRITNNDTFKVFQNALKILSKPIKKNINDNLKNIKSEKNFSFYRQIALANRTYTEIAKENSITCTTVSKYVENIRYKFINHFRMFKHYLLMKSTNTKIFDTIVSEVYKEDDIYLIEYAIKKGAFKTVEYYSELDKFIINEKVSTIKKKIKKIINQCLPELFDLYDEQVYISEMLKYSGLEFLSINDFGKLLISQGFSNVNSWYSKNKRILVGLFILVITEDFRDKITLDKAGIVAIKEKLESRFGISDLSERTISNLVKVFFVSKNENIFIGVDNTYIELKLFYDIKNYIEELQLDKISITDVFKRFQVQLKEYSTIRDKFCLYTVLEYFYKNRFEFKGKFITKKHKTEHKS